MFRAADSNRLSPEHADYRQSSDADALIWLSHYRKAVEVAYPPHSPGRRATRPKTFVFGHAVK
jgi:hypothetical protein